MNDLRDIQLTQLEILLEFDRICKKHRIQYHLFAGTLLGAVRHKGFIPWDDDIDVCMLRSEYDRFLSVYTTELADAYFLQNSYTDPSYYNIFSRIRKNGTFFDQPTYTEFNFLRVSLSIFSPWIIYLSLFFPERIKHTRLRYCVFLTEKLINSARLRI